MIKKIKDYIQYKKKIRLLKVIAVNHLTNIVINKSHYIDGFEKLLLTMSSSDDASELQELLNEYVDLVKRTKIANYVITKGQE